MRISDWSSDVCSSDLLVMRGVGGEFGAAIFGQLTLDPVDKAAVGEMADYRQARGDAIGRHAPRDAKHRRAIDEVIAAPHRPAAMRGTRLVAGETGLYAEDAADRISIGRASGRERVVQNV